MGADDLRTPHLGRVIQGLDKQRINRKHPPRLTQHQPEQGAFIGGERDGPIALPNHVISGIELKAAEPNGVPDTDRLPPIPDMRGQLIGQEGMIEGFLHVGRGPRLEGRPPIAGFAQNNDWEVSPFGDYKGQAIPIGKAACHDDGNKVRTPGIPPFSGKDGAADRVSFMAQNVRQKPNPARVPIDDENIPLASSLHMPPLLRERRPITYTTYRQNSHFVNHSKITASFELGQYDTASLASNLKASGGNI